MRCPWCEAHMQDDKALAYVRCLNQKCRGYRDWMPHIGCVGGKWPMTWRTLDAIRRGELRALRLG